MKYIVPVAVLGVLLLQASGAIPASSVGGPMVIALAVFAGALAVAIHEAWTRKRGVLGWIANVLLSFLGAFIAAPLGGFLMAMALGPFLGGSSLAAAGEPVFSISLAGTMLIALLGSWGALEIMNRVRGPQP